MNFAIERGIAFPYTSSPRERAIDTSPSLLLASDSKYVEPEAFHAHDFPNAAEWLI